MLFKSRRLGCFFTEQFGNLDFCVIEIILIARILAFFNAVYCFTLFRRANGLSRLGQLLSIRVGALGFDFALTPIQLAAYLVFLIGQHKRVCSYLFQGRCCAGDKHTDGLGEIFNSVE